MATISYNIRATQEAARAKAEAAALAAGKSAIEADSIGNAAGNKVGASELERIRGELGNNSASDDGSNAGTNNTAADPAGSTTVSDRSQTGQKSGVPNSSNKDQIDQQFPGARKTNPLSNYSSYSYILQLYMVTPEILTKLANNKGILPTDSESKKQTVLVAQSGGINNQADNRALPYSKKIGPANQSGLDFYIEDLNMTAAVAPDSPPTSYSFKIIEPLGYTLLTRLMETSKALNKLSSVAGMIDGPPLSVQNYVIGIKFVGYDVNGNITNSTSVSSSSANSNSETSTTITPRYFPIRIEKVNFKLSGQSTVYDVTAIPFNEQAGSGQKNGQIYAQGEIPSPKGKVGEALQGLMDKLNSYQRSLVEVSQDKSTNYSIKYLPGAEEIRDSSLLDDTQIETQLNSMSKGVNTTSQSNIKQGVAAVSRLTTSRTTSLTAGTSILTGIDIIISKSDYIGKALSKINTAAVETTTESGQQGVELKWYSCNLVTTISGYDKATQTYVYDIVYEIGVYPVSYIKTPMKVTKSKYPGPYKLYNYLLTGENTEVLDYELTFDNLYAIINTAKSNSDSSITPAVNLVGKNAMIMPAPATNSIAIGGKQNAGSAMQDSIRAQLNLDGNNDAVTVNIKIMGDPDWLMTQVGNFQGPFNEDNSTTQTDAAAGSASQSTLNTIKNAYGDNYSVNPLSGQIFCQIIFYMAEDYNDLSYNNKSTDGLLDVSDELNFFDDTTRKDSGIKGIVYKVFQVTSTFNNGTFTQVLVANIAEKDLFESETTNDSSGRETASSAPASDTRSSLSSSDTMKKVNESLPTDYGDSVYSSTNSSAKNTPSSPDDDKNTNAASIDAAKRASDHGVLSEASARAAGINTNIKTGSGGAGFGLTGPAARAAARAANKGTQ